MYSERQRPDQKLVGLYLLATIWMVNREDESGERKTETTPSWKWASRYFSAAASSAALSLHISDEIRMQMQKRTHRKGSDSSVSSTGSGSDASYVRFEYIIQARETYHAPA